MIMDGGLCIMIIPYLLAGNTVVATILLQKCCKREKRRIEFCKYRVVLIHYDAATLQFREKTVTGAMWNSGNSGNPAVYALEYFGGRYFIGQGGGSVDVVDVDGAFVDRLIVESVGIVRGLVVSL